MHFDLSKPQSLLQQSVREFCKREFSSQRVREMVTSGVGIDQRLWQEFVDQGWVGMHLSEDIGGLGLGIVELAVVMEEFGRACVPGPLLTTNWALSLMSAATQSQPLVELSAVLEGTSHVSAAVFEAQAPWGTQASELLTQIDSERTLNGSKQFVYHAEHAANLVVVAGFDGELCIALVPTNHPGVTTTSTTGMDASRACSRCDFDRVPLKDFQMLAVGRDTCAALAHAEQVGAVMVCSEMLGLMEWMLFTSVEYAKSRQQFGRVVGSYQAVQHKCADMLLLTESARSATWYAAWALQMGEADAAQAVSIAKVYTSDAVRDISNMAVQVHGGVGFTWEHDLHFYYKRAKADELLLGDSTFHRERLAEMILK